MKSSTDCRNGDLAMINTSSLKCLKMVIPFNQGVVENGYLLTPPTRQSQIASPWYISNMADRCNYKPKKKVYLLIYIMRSARPH